MALNKILDACHCNPFHHDDPENEVKDAPMPPEQAPKEVMADDDDANADESTTTPSNTTEPPTEPLLVY